MPEERKAGRARWFIFAALLVFASFTLAYRDELARIVGVDADPPAPSAFAGASRSRVFLSPAEQQEAADRGLMPPGTRSIIATGGALQYGQWKWDEAAVPPGPLRVRVSLRRQLVSVFRGPHEIGTAVIVYGSHEKGSPVGSLPILRKVRDYHSITYDAPMPYSLFIREDGVAVHGSPIAADKATNGCVGLPVAFAEKLFAIAEVGDVIEIRDGN